MHQFAKKGLLVVITTTGALASAAVGVANAGSAADGAAVGSPGVASGNNIQIPIHVPVNVCGNTVNVIGALNPAFGNHCVNASNPTHPPQIKPPATKPPTTKPPTTHPPTTHPPATKPPTMKPPTTGGTSGGTTGGTTGGSTGGSSAGATGDTTGGSTSTGSLAQTGSNALTVAPIGAALLLGGFVLYRRSRPAQD
ncbi:chaplin [Embleya sp. NPDC005575]|uniref:chaplin n=1 Tax=Embleya sp. NPDC005575 TaxID=3156892 RepID=UPI0033A2197A